MTRTSADPFGWDQSQAELREREISKADHTVECELQYLIECLAERDPRYLTKEGYPAAMYDAAKDYIATLTYRLENGQLV